MNNMPFFVPNSCLIVMNEKMIMMVMVVVMRMNGFLGSFLCKGENKYFSIRPGRLLFRFFEPNSLTREKTLSLLGFSQLLPMLLLGLLAQRPAFAFSRSLACLFCRMRELAIAAAVASLAVRWWQHVPDGN